MKNGVTCGQCLLKISNGITEAIELLSASGVYGIVKCIVYRVTVLSFLNVSDRHCPCRSMRILFDGQVFADKMFLFCHSFSCSSRQFAKKTTILSTSRKSDRQRNTKNGFKLNHEVFGAWGLRGKCRAGAVVFVRYLHDKKKKKT